MTPTYAIIETPPGRSAVAVVRVVGPAATAAVDACFRAANGKPLVEQPPGAIRFGRWLGEPGEELVVCQINQQTIEVHCHGGHAAVRAVVDDLAEHGVVRRDWREVDSVSIQSEVLQALAECSTDRTAAILLDQQGGALEQALGNLVGLLNAGACAESQAAIDLLMQHADLGMHLARPWRVVLAGPPNVGKSSLINALVGYERAIVFDQPGVTRDVLTAAAAVDGWPIELADTAGLRDAEGEIEAAGIRLAREVASEADLLILVEAYNEQPAPGELPASELLGQLGLVRGAERRLLRVGNKRDLLPAVSGSREPAEAVLSISASTGDGIEQLVAAMGQTLVPAPPEAGTAVPFTARQVAALRLAGESVANKNLAAACQAVQSLLASSSE